MNRGAVVAGVAVVAGYLLLRNGTASAAPTTTTTRDAFGRPLLPGEGNALDDAARAVDLAGAAVGIGSALAATLGKLLGAGATAAGGTTTAAAATPGGLTHARTPETEAAYQAQRAGERDPTMSTPSVPSGADLLGGGVPSPAQLANLADAASPEMAAAIDRASAAVDAGGVPTDADLSMLARFAGVDTLAGGVPSAAQLAALGAAASPTTAAAIASAQFSVAAGGVPAAADLAVIYAGFSGLDTAALSTGAAFASAGELPGAQILGSALDAVSGAVSQFSSSIGLTNLLSVAIPGTLLTVGQLIPVIGIVVSAVVALVMQPGDYVRKRRREQAEVGHLVPVLAYFITTATTHAELRRAVLDAPHYKVQAALDSQERIIIAGHHGDTTGQEAYLNRLYQQQLALLLAAATGNAAARAAVERIRALNRERAAAFTTIITRWAQQVGGSVPALLGAWAADPDALAAQLTTLLTEDARTVALMQHRGETAAAAPALATLRAVVSAAAALGLALPDVDQLVDQLRLGLTLDGGLNIEHLPEYTRATLDVSTGVISSVVSSSGDLLARAKRWAEFSWPGYWAGGGWDALPAFLQRSAFDDVAAGTDLRTDLPGWSSSPLPVVVTPAASYAPDAGPRIVAVVRDDVVVPAYIEYASGEEGSRGLQYAINPELGVVDQQAVAMANARQAALEWAVFSGLDEETQHALTRVHSDSGDGGE